MPDSWNQCQRSRLCRSYPAPYETVFVEENHRHVLPTRFLNHRTAAAGSTRLIASAFTPFASNTRSDRSAWTGHSENHSSAAELWRGFRILLNSLAHYRHKVISYL